MHPYCSVLLVVLFWIRYEGLGSAGLMVEGRRKKMEDKDEEDVNVFVFLPQIMLLNIVTTVELFKVEV